jgi:hypothetical protein
MKPYLPEIILLLVGAGVMALLLYLGALSEGWVAVLCFLGTAVVYTGWYRVLLKLARRILGCEEDDEDQPFFPG